MRKKFDRSRCDKGVVFEGLEGRMLLAWGQIPQLISLDDARARFPTIDGRGQTIATIDAGVNMSHPKLVDSIFHNPGEVVDGKDNDGDGYVDDVTGWDFLANDRDPKDEQGHGTMVASTLAANRFTNTGNPHLAGSADYKEYEGVASGARLLPLRISGTNLTFSDANLEKALQYVIRNRVRFNITAVNFSLAVTSGGWSRIQDEVATLNSAGVFMAGVSGNGGFVSGSGSKPGDSPYAMSVGAVNPDGSVNSITIRGSWLDVVAPGNKVVYLDRGTSYWVGGAGTSYAAPWVTATGVLIKQVNRNFSTEQIRQIIHDSGQNVYDSMSKLTFKRLDVAAAIDLAYKRSGAAVPSPVPPTPVPPATPSTTTQSPYGGTPAALPGTIQAENFDNGGQNVSFWDTTGGNDAGKYRSTAVDVEATSDTGGGYDVGFTKAGEWLEYTVDVKAAGTYTLEARVASQFSGGALHVEVDGADKTGRLGVPNTGGWQKFASVTKAVSLPAGRHVLRLKFDANSSAGYAGNVNWLKLTAGATTPAPVSGARSAFSNIAAASFNTSKGVNKSGSGISWVDGGDYVGYNNIDFGSTGATKFSVSLAVPASSAGKKILVRIGGATGQVVGTLVTRGTGGWGVYQTQTISISRVTGLRNLYLTFEGGGGVGNISWFRFA
jgi:hypothetical protein